MWTPNFVLRAHLDGIRALAFTESHPALLSASDDGTVKLWNLRKLTRGRDELEPVFSYRGHSKAVLAVAVSEQRSEVYSSGLDSTVRMWRLLPSASHSVRYVSFFVLKLSLLCVWLWFNFHRHRPSVCIANVDRAAVV